jgi:hypothetical protein
MADTPGLEPGGGNSVEVRLLSPVLNKDTQEVVGSNPTRERKRVPVAQSGRVPASLFYRMEAYA